MENTELRVGNYLSIGGKGRENLSIVTGTGYKNNEEIVFYFPKILKCVGEVKNKSLNMYSLMTYVEPIPLTEEWLKKFGFKQIGRSISYKKTINEIPYCIDIREFNSRHVSIVGACTIAIIMYVHELQNLCFALTGKELTINEKK